MKRTDRLVTNAKRRLAALLGLTMCLMLALCLAGCEERGEEVELQVFAANSLEKALPEVQELYHAQHEDVTFADTQFKSSGDLVAELEGGASADLLITASGKTMDKAEQKELIQDDSRVTMFDNDLVVITAEDSPITITDLSQLADDSIASIAIGEPNAVPAGNYAAQALQAAGLIECGEGRDGTISITGGAIAGKLNAGADKVGTISSYVASGTCQVGLVYSSDLYRYSGTKGIYTVPDNLHKAITYPGAVTADTQHAETAADFIEFCLNDDRAQEIFQRYGFEPADGTSAAAGTQAPVSSTKASASGSLADDVIGFFATLDWRPLWVSLKTAGVAMVFVFVLGLLAAWRALRVKSRWKSVLDSVLTIPMVLPPTVCGFLLLLLFGKSTGFGQFLIDHGISLVFSWEAAVIAAVVVAFPLMYRTALGAFEALDADMLDAARTLGWSEGRIFRKLMLPLAWPSIAAGTVLSFARAMGEFGCTLFFAGNYAGVTQTIPIAIYFTWMGGSTDVALFWVIVVILFSFLVILFINLWGRHATKYRRKEVSGDA